MAGTSNINGDLYTRHRQAIEQIGPGTGRGKFQKTAATAAAPSVAPVTLAERWRSATVAVDDQVARQLIASQSESDDPVADDTTGTDGMTGTGGDAGTTSPADPSAPADPVVQTDPGGPATPTTPVADVPPADVPPDVPPVVDGSGDPSATTPTAPIATPPATPEPVVAGAADALVMLLRAQAAANDPVLQYKRSLFNSLDTDRDGAVSTTELSTAVAAGGGNDQAAGALAAQLDPAGSGSITLQQFTDNLPNPVYDYSALGFGDSFAQPITAGDAVAALYMGAATAAASGAPTPVEQAANDAPAPTALTPFDFDRNGALDLHELMAAVRRGGGSDASAQAAMTQLDPQGTGSVTAEQLAANLPMPNYDLLGFGTESGQPYDPVMQEGVTSLVSAISAANTPEARATRDLFVQLDGNNDGTVTADDLNQAVTAAGGSSDAAAALYAQIDPGNTGGVTMEQFMDNLPPVDIDANGVVTARAPATQPQTETAMAAPATTAPTQPLPTAFSSSVLSVLLQMQAT